MATIASKSWGKFGPDQNQIIMDNYKLKPMITDVNALIDKVINNV
jgi:hypothetical protein